MTTKTKGKTTFTCIGFVPVDTGMVAICDPCSPDRMAAEFRALGGRTPGDDQGYKRDDPDSGVAVFSSTWGGDGVFPVYAERDADGRTLSLTIDFDPYGYAETPEALQAVCGCAERPAEEKPKRAKAQLVANLADAAEDQGRLADNLMGAAENHPQLAEDLAGLAEQVDQLAEDLDQLAERADQTLADIVSDEIDNEDLQVAAAAAVRKLGYGQGSAERVKALMQEFHVDRLGDLPQEKRADFVARVRKIAEPAS